MLELSFDLIDQCIALGELALARTLIDRVTEAVEPPQGIAKAWLLGEFGGQLVRSGDPERGRALLEQSRRAALALKDPEARKFVLPMLAAAHCKAGDLDGALALFHDMTPPTQDLAINHLLEALAADRRDLDLGGIDIWIYPLFSPKDPVAARAALPKIAAAAQTLADANARARDLAMIAPFQAKASDLAGALATARSIPDLKQSTSDGRVYHGYYVAAKPIALASIAGIQAKAGDKSAAVAVLDEAQALARALEAVDQKLIAQIVVAQKYSACGRQSTAQAIINEALALALTQPEPRRSRVLSMLAEVQVQAGDAKGAARTIDSIRDFPGLEKAKALSILARWHKEAGDAATFTTLLHRAVACLEAKAPETLLPGKVMDMNTFGYNTFFRLDFEMNAPVLAIQRNHKLQSLRESLGDFDSAVRAANALPPERRDDALSGIACDLGRRGDIAGAMDLAASIESADARLRAFAWLATAIPEGQTRK